MFNNFRGRVYGIPRNLPWAGDKKPTPGTSGASAAPSLEDRGLFVSGPGTQGNNETETNKTGATHMSRVREMEDTAYKMFRSRGESHEEAQASAALFMDLPPRNLRPRMGDTDPEDGTIEALEHTAYRMFRGRGYPHNEAARSARAWVSR